MLCVLKGPQFRPVLELSKLLSLVLIFFFNFQSQGQSPTSMWKDECASQQEPLEEPEVGDSSVCREQTEVKLCDWELMEV